jgi:hypothetical protein
MKGRTLFVCTAIVLLSTCFCETGLANDWRVERLTQLGPAQVKHDNLRKAECSLQTDQKIQDVCNRYWDLIDARFSRLRPALEFMIALDKVSGHNKLKSDIAFAMNEQAFDAEAHEIASMVEGSKPFILDQSKANIREK